LKKLAAAHADPMMSTVRARARRTSVPLPAPWTLDASGEAKVLSSSLTARRESRKSLDQSAAACDEEFASMAKLVAPHLDAVAEVKRYKEEITKNGYVSPPTSFFSEDREFSIACLHGATPLSQRKSTGRQHSND
jgi:hypothetical protein